MLGDSVPSDQRLEIQTPPQSVHPYCIYVVLTRNAYVNWIQRLQTSWMHSKEHNLGGLWSLCLAVYFGFVAPPPPPPAAAPLINNHVHKSQNSFTIKLLVTLFAYGDRRTMESSGGAVIGHHHWIIEIPHNTRGEWPVRECGVCCGKSIELFITISVNNYN